MSDTIRDVLIRLKVQQEAFKVEVPDVSPLLQAAKDIEDAFGRLNQASQQASAGTGNAGNTNAGGSAASGAAAAAASRSAAAATGDQAAEEAKLLEALRNKNVAVKYGEQAAREAAIQNSNYSDATKQAAIALIQETEATRRSIATRNEALATRRRQVNEGEKLIQQLQAEGAGMNMSEKAARILKVQQSDLSDAYKKSAIALIESNEAMKEQGRVAGHIAQAGDAFKMAGEGALHLARGVALLTAASEDDIQVIAKQFAMYTAGLDIFKGSIDMVKGLVTGSKALTAAHLAASATAGIQAASTGVLTASLLSARAAALQLWASLGPIGWAVIAITAAVGTGIYIWNRWTQAQKDARAVTVAYMQDIAVASARLIDQKKAVKELTEAQVSNAEKLETSAQLYQIKSEAIVAGPVGGEHKTEAQRAADEIKSQQDVFNRKMALLTEQGAKERELTLKQLKVSDADAKRAATDDTAFQQLRTKLTKQATFVQASLDLQQQVVDQARERADRNPENKGLQQAVYDLEVRRSEQLAYQKTLQNGLQELGKYAVTNEKNKLAILEQQRTAIQGNIDKYRSMNDANRQAQIDEANRGKSLAQKFGALEKPAQERLKSLASRVGPNGDLSKLNRGEQEELRASGFADSIFSKFDLQRGQAAGSDALFKQLGTFKPGTTDLAEGQGADETRLEFLKRQESDNKAAIAEYEKKLSEVIKTKGEQVDKVLDLVSQLGDLTPLIRKLDVAINLYKDHLAEVEQVIDKLGFDIKRGQLYKKQS